MSVDHQLPDRRETADEADSQGWAISPLLSSIYASDCTTKYSAVKLLKFADDTTVTGHIQDGDESAYQWKVEWLPEQSIAEQTQHCGDNSGVLETTLNTIHLHKIQQPRVNCGDHQVFRNYYFPRPELGDQCQLLLWKGPAKMYFLQQLTKCGLPQELLSQFYTAVFESVLCTFITIWFAAATKQDRNRLQQTKKTVKQYHCSPPHPPGLILSRTWKRPGEIITNSIHSFIIFILVKLVGSA